MQLPLSLVSVKTPESVKHVTPEPPFPPVFSGCLNTSKRAVQIVVWKTLWRGLYKAAHCCRILWRTVKSSSHVKNQRYFTCSVTTELQWSLFLLRWRRAQLTTPATHTTSKIEPTNKQKNTDRKRRLRGNKTHDSERARERVEKEPITETQKKIKNGRGQSLNSVTTALYLAELRGGRSLIKLFSSPGFEPGAAGNQREHYSTDLNS